MKRHLSILFIMMLVAAGSAWAEPATTPEPEVDGAETEIATTPIHGMQMWKDQETGELRAPTREEAAYFSNLLKKMFAQKAEAPQMRRLKNGTLAVELGESMMEFSVVRIDADGKLTQGCVDDADQALEFIDDSRTVNREEE